MRERRCWDRASTEVGGWEGKREGRRERERERGGREAREQEKKRDRDPGNANNVIDTLTHTT